MQIVLTGTYNSKNKGDAAMEISTAAALSFTSQDIKVRIHSPFSELDESFYAPVPVIKCSRRRLIWGSFLVFRAFVWRVSGMSFLVKGNAELESYISADAIVDLSGDMQTESYGPHVTYSHFIPIALALAMKKPVVLCGQSVGPFKWTAILAKFLYDRVNSITVRDKISENYLMKMAVKCPVFHTADMAFLLKPCSPERVDEIFSREGISLDHKPFLGVSVSGLIAHHFSKSNPMAGKTDFYRFMAAELDEVISELDIDCVFVAHVTGPGNSKDDRKAADSVVKHMAYADRAHIIRGDYRPEELKGVISRLSMHTGARMHASIAAVTTGVPVAAIAYSHKTPGVMAQFGLDRYVLDISSWEKGKLLEHLKVFIKNRGQISQTLNELTYKLRAKSMQNINVIRSLLKKNKEGSQ